MWFALRFSIRQKPLNWTMKQCHFRKIDWLHSAKHPIALCPAHWVLVWLAIHCITGLRYSSSTGRERACIMLVKIKEGFKLVMGQCMAGLLIKAQFGTEEEILCLTYTDVEWRKVWCPTLPRAAKQKPGDVQGRTKVQPAETPCSPCSLPSLVLSLGQQ